MDRSLLVVASVEKDGARVDLLPPKDGQCDLDSAVAAVDKVAVEEVPIRLRREAAAPEDMHQVE
eukprot:4856450-Prymnesium_polylepis.1